MRISLDQLKKLIREEVHASSQKLIREQDLWDAEELDAEAAATACMQKGPRLMLRPLQQLA